MGSSKRLGVLAERSAAALTALVEAVPALRRETPTEVAAAAVERGFFRPAEEEVLWAWFARFLSVRDATWTVLDDVSRPVAGHLSRVETEAEWRLFLLGYGAACTIVTLDRLLVERLATDSITQRKINEGSPERRIPRKQFTAVFESLAEPSQALLMVRAMRLATANRRRLEAMATEPMFEPIVRRLAELERALDPSKRKYLRLLGRFSDHSLRRRTASVRQQGLFALLESAGRFASVVRDRWAEKRVAEEVRRELAALLRPGDVLVTRHDNALTNLFLPGYWPHAALYVGTTTQRDELGVALDAARREQWSGDRCVLEALKDGVRFRPLSEALAVDAVAVIRPRFGRTAIARGIAQAAEHEGKLYNFDFDFFRSDRLVCTEVVYRAFDGLEGREIKLQERAGRPTLSAEDLLDLALEGELFEPLAVFGCPGTDVLLVGHGVGEALAASYGG